MDLTRIGLVVAVAVLALWVGGVPAPRPAASVEQTERGRPTDGAEVSPSDFLHRLGVAAWHKSGIRGQGVKVAILDSGFRGYQNFLGHGLPKSVQARSFRYDHNLEARDSQHGIFCAEIVRQIAPQAELLLANWEPDQPRSFIEAVRWARSQGARVFSCSLIMPSWSDGEGGGEVHRALRQLLGGGEESTDLLFFASAGNTAQRHWSGRFHPDARGWHQWEADQSQNVITPWGQERVAVELYGSTAAPYELVVYEIGTGRLIGQSRFNIDPLTRSGKAVVRFEPNPKSQYGVRLRCHGTPDLEKLHLVLLGGTLQISNRAGSISFPGDGTRVVTVGAVENQSERACYSSCGPNSQFPKPDFVANVPFPTGLRDRPFTGTSAAAPQAAALAALLWSRQPTQTPNQIHRLFRDHAIDLGPRGHDWETGYGLLKMP